MSSGLHMPGAFHTEGIHQGLFRPPGSPASSSGYLPPARPAAEAPTPKRKRIRDNGSTALLTPGRHVGNHGRAYTLAGQLDTPLSGPADSELLGESMYSDSDYRKALGSKRSRDDVDAADSSGPTPLFNLPAHPNHQSPGWSTLAFSTLGGVVGKVWEFCKTGAFKGFYAGGGRGFEMQPGEGVLPDGSIPDQAWHLNDDYDENQHRIPGHFPQVEGDDQGIAEESYLPSGASTPSAPAAKRRQTAPVDELGRNWVMVKDHAAEDTRTSSTPRRTSTYMPSPRNRNQGPSVVTGRRISTPNQRRVSSRLASAASFRASPRTNGFNTSPPSTLEPPRPASSASFASPRSLSPTKFSSMTPTIVASSGSPTPGTSRGHSRRRSLNHPSHQSFTHSRTHSSASTASSRGAQPDDIDNSPRLTAEARQLAARRQREERDTDVRMATFNKQLQDMIRQGKEALRTTIEVDGEDGGWEDY
ncbi:hypothetical protein QQS21_005255 [Conoideocrella luteorostrata]|uniref:Uncharacterized protein n=1 Tax=Conoideocrella luteorostrata TaxID=1105319 RepID=A0AAJ0CSK0_9HYPO|nr:hypothetical protein QQS21_005255 [Conoideocrella luteorostrata]